MRSCIGPQNAAPAVVNSMEIGMMLNNKVPKSIPYVKFEVRDALYGFCTGLQA